MNHYTLPLNITTLGLTHDYPHGPQVLPPLALLTTTPHGP